MRRALALFVMAIAGFAFGFAGCGGMDDDDGAPGQGGTTDTVMTTDEDEGGGIY